jgi:Protein of unknown function (DUF2852)
MGWWNHQDRWANKMERMRGRMERRGFGFGGFGPPSSGNPAFDEYRVETLKRPGALGGAVVDTAIGLR